MPSKEVLTISQKLTIASREFFVFVLWVLVLEHEEEETNKSKVISAVAEYMKVEPSLLLEIISLKKIFHNSRLQTKLDKVLTVKNKSHFEDSVYSALRQFLLCGLMSSEGLSFFTSKRRFGRGQLFHAKKILEAFSFLSKDTENGWMKLFRAHFSDSFELISSVASEEDLLAFLFPESRSKSSTVNTTLITKSKVKPNKVVNKKASASINSLSSDAILKKCHRMSPHARVPFDELLILQWLCGKASLKYTDVFSQYMNGSIDLSDLVIRAGLNLEH